MAVRRQLSPECHHGGKEAGTEWARSIPVHVDWILVNSTFLEKYLNRFHSDQQGMEDVVQEVYLRVYTS